MYAMVLSVLAAAFLVGCGGFFVFAAIAILFATLRDERRRDTPALWVAVVFFPMGSVFIVAGLVQFAGVVRQLRGMRAHDTTVERTFTVLNRPMFGEQPYDQPRE
jgi:hypothetical protein